MAMTPAGDLLDIERLQNQLKGTREALDALLKNVGSPGKCQGCGADIFWVRHGNGKNVPYNADGRNHFITCPAAEQFRRRKGEHARTTSNKD